jgi:peptidoglycan/xylan/chitin deacetylase (PgdA/CDA1 family)
VRKVFNGIKRFTKHVLYFIAFYSGLVHVIIRVLKFKKDNHSAVILFYHRFSKAGVAGYQLPHLDIQEFRKQMQHIKRWYQVITMDELANVLDGQNRFKWPCVVITIDDGYLNNFTLAYPILREFKLPATIYLTTGFVGTSKAPWVDELSGLLFGTEARGVSFPELLGEERIDISSVQGKKEAGAKLFKAMLKLDPNRRRLALRELSKIMAIGEISTEIDQRRMLDWDEVTEMKKNGIAFGAHTVSHPTLSRMELSEAMREIYESKIEVERKIGDRVRHFAIPNGKKEDFNTGLGEYCKEIGLSTVVSTEPGVVLTCSDRYFLRRISPSPPIHVFACELTRYMFLRRVRKFDHPKNRSNLC